MPHTYLVLEQNGAWENINTFKNISHLLQKHTHTYKQSFFFFIITQEKAQKKIRCNREKSTEKMNIQAKREIFAAAQIHTTFLLITHTHNFRKKLIFFPPKHFTDPFFFFRLPHTTINT